DLAGGGGVVAEELHQHVHDKLLGRVIVIMQDDLVHRRPLDLLLLQRPEVPFGLGQGVELPVAVVRTLGHLCWRNPSALRGGHKSRRRAGRASICARAHWAASRTIGLSSPTRRCTTGRADASRAAPRAKSAFRLTPSYCARASAVPALSRSKSSRDRAASSAGGSALMGRGSKRASPTGMSSPLKGHASWQTSQPKTRRLNPRRSGTGTSAWFSMLW